MDALMQNNAEAIVMVAVIKTENFLALILPDSRKRIRSNQRFYFRVYIFDSSCDIIHMCTYQIHAVFFGMSHLIFFLGFNNSMYFYFERA